MKIDFDEFEEYQLKKSAEELKYYCYTILIFTAIILFLFFALKADASECVDLNKIMIIESSGNSHAWNKKDDSRGLFQITPICLKEYNNFHKVKYSMDDLWDSSINTLIADWYINVRIPQMLRHYKKPVTVENIIIAYNAGISYIVNNNPLPEITRSYLKKYERLAQK